MTAARQVTARQEWAAMWPLPFVAMLGLSGSAMFAYSSGIFMEDMTKAFGWSRTAFASAFMLQMLLGLFTVPAVGWLIDRVGPRRVALFGVVPFAAAFALLGMVSGSLIQWWSLCALLAVAQAAIAQTVWITAVVGRFRASRGLAMAITLAGLGLGSLIWPILTAFYIDRFGWRATFPALALTWGVVILPLAALFFFGSHDRGPAPPRLAKRPYGAALRSRTFIGLVVAGGLFACSYYGLIVHLVPILRASGVSLQAASAVAGLAGLFSIGGRIATGYLLDHVPVRAIGGVIFLLPIAVVALLLAAPGSVPVAMLAVALLGLASGAEMDIVTFIAARRFGQEVFASVYAIFVALLAVSAGAGPLLGGALFDMGQSYTPFLLIIMPVALVCTTLILWVPIDATAADA